MSAAANYYNNPGSAQVAVATLNTNVDGTGTMGAVAVSGTSAGRRIREARATTAVGTGLANKITVFESLDGGTTKKFLCDIILPAATNSATVKGASQVCPELVGKVLGGSAASPSTNHQLYFATWIAQATNIEIAYDDA